MIFDHLIKTDRIFFHLLLLIAAVQNFNTEAGKHNRKCGSDSFHCGSGDCINNLLACDGILHCKDGSDETSAVCSNTFCPPFMFRCNYGGCVKISSICNGVFDCNDQSDEPPINECRIPGYPKPTSGTTNSPPKTKPTKSPTPAPTPITSTSTTTTTEIVPVTSGSCQLPIKTEDQDYIINDCDKQPGGTYCDYTPGQYIDQFATITLRCNPNYYSQIAENTTAFCLEGSWTPSIVHCEECGLTTAPGNVNDNYVPWLVAIYDSQRSYNICWGTLLSPFTILTAAHCIFDEISNQKKEPSNFFVLLGKNLLSGEEDDSTKRYKISSITLVNDAFDGAKSNYKANLAIFEMDSKITYTDYIKPVCVDWQNRINFRPNDGVQGFIPAWILNRQAARGELRPQKSPYISSKNCRTLAPESSKPYVTDDKFCATLTPGTTIDGGNGGNGFYLTNSNRKNYHLFGVVSTHFYDRSNTPVLIVTDLGKYRAQVQSFVDEIENKRKSDELIDVRFPTERPTPAGKKSN